MKRRVIGMYCWTCALERQYRASPSSPASMFSRMYRPSVGTSALSRLSRVQPIVNGTVVLVLPKVSR